MSLAGLKTLPEQLTSCAANRQFWAPRKVRLQGRGAEAETRSHWSNESSLDPTGSDRVGGLRAWNLEVQSSSASLKS